MASLMRLPTSMFLYLKDIVADQPGRGILIGGVAANVVARLSRIILMYLLAPLSRFVISDADSLGLMCMQSVCLDGNVYELLGIQGNSKVPSSRLPLSLSEEHRAEATRIAP
jgi:hypothetical protein